jgi:hypothetical protein
VRRGDGLEKRAVVTTRRQNATAGQSARSSRVVPLAATRFRARATRKNALSLAACPAKSREFLLKRLRGTARLREDAKLETRHARTEH